MKAKWWLLLFMVFLVIVFTIQNYAAVNLKFLFWTISTSQAILVFVCLFAGIIIGVLLSRPR